MTVLESLMEILPADEADAVVTDLQDQFYENPDGIAMAVTSQGIVTAEREQTKIAVRHYCDDCQH
jgi:hypothetical protein